MDTFQKIDAYEVPFTQFILPNGRRETTYFETSEEVYTKAMKMIEAELSFEIELLRTGHVHATITDHRTDIGDIKSVVCNNGPDVVTKINDMIMNFDLDNYDYTKYMAPDDDI
jgi:hypothetical protein